MTAATRAISAPNQGRSFLDIGAKLRPYLVIVGIVIAWEILARSGLIEELVLPKFSTVIVTMVDGIRSGTLIYSAGWSILRVLMGFFIGAFLAVPIGLLIGWSKTISDLFNPVIEVLRPVPPLAWIPLAVIWVGVGMSSVIFITVLGSFFPIVVSVIAGVRAVDRKVIEYSRTLGASTSQILRHVVIPLMLPPAFVGMRIAVGFTWMCVVAAEMISVKWGLGWMIWQARYKFDTPSVIVGMITIGVLSVLMTKGMLMAEKRLFKWREGVVKGD